MRGSIQLLGPRRWRLVFDIGRDQSGKRRQKVVNFRGNKRDAEKELARLIAEFENGGFVEPNKLTVASYLMRWLHDHAEMRISPKSAERYREICEKHIVPALGSHRLAKLQPMHIQEYYAEALRSGRRDGKGGLAARTVLHHHRVLRQALQQAIRWLLLSRNPADAVDPPRPNRREILVPDEQQTARLINGAKGSSLFIPVLLAACAGIRRGEALAVRWSDLDENRGTLSVVRSLEQTAAGVRFKGPKTERGRRVVTLPSIALDALREHRVNQAELRLRLGLGRGDGGLICAGEDGTPRSPRAFSKSFKRLAKKLNMPGITFHSLRHGHATQLLRSGIHPKIAQERLGHSTIATTLDLYSHCTPDMQEDAAVRTDAVIRAALEKRKGNGD